MIENAPFRFSKYPQYTLEDWNDYSIFDLKNKKFYERKKLFIGKSIEQNKTHYRFISSMIFFHWMAKTNFFNLYDRETTNRKKMLVDNLWASYFHYVYYKDIQPLSYAFMNMLEFMDQSLLAKIHELIKYDEVTPFYSEDYALAFLKMTQYKSKSREMLGKVIYADDTPTAMKTLKNLVSPLIDRGIGFLKQTLNQTPQYKGKAKILKQDSHSVIESFGLLTEEEKITFAEYCIRKYSNYSEGVEFIKNLRKIYTLTKHYPITDEIMKHDYERLINHDLRELLAFMDTYKNEDVDSILVQIKMMNKAVLKMYRVLDADVKKLIRVKNRFLDEKHNDKKVID